MSFIVDFAGLADYQIAAASPFLWASWSEFKFGRCRSDISADELRLAASIAVRWGDPRINDILDWWAQALLLPGKTGLDVERRLHGKHLAVVFPNSIWELHVIPKAMTTPDTDSTEDDPPPLDPEFNPYVYQRDGRAVVIPWGQTEAMVETKLEFHGLLAFYAEVDRHFLSWHIGAPIEQPTDGMKVAYTP